MEMRMVGLSEEQKLIWRMCREFVDEKVIPFVRENRDREWLAPPEERLPADLLRGADELGLRTLGVPEQYGGTQLDAQAQTFAIIAEELARGDSGFADHLADMATRLETVRAFTRYAARALDEGASDAGQLCLMAKIYASETVFDVCKQAMELHGGSGVMREMGIEKHFRDAAVFLHMDGTTDIHRFKIVKAMFPDTAGTYAGPGEEATTDA